MSKSESILEPLPSLNVITNVEKLDAGLRGLDHCELLLQMLWSACVAKLVTRQDEAPIMALHASSTTYSYSTLGDAAFSSHPAERAMSSPRHLLFDNREPWDSYFFHDSLTNSLLVRLHKSGEGHGARTCFRSLFQWFS